MPQTSVCRGSLPQGSPSEKGAWTGQTDRVPINACTVGESVNNDNQNARNLWPGDKNDCVWVWECGSTYPRFETRDSGFGTQAENLGSWVNEGALKIQS